MIKQERNEVLSIKQIAVLTAFIIIIALILYFAIEFTIETIKEDNTCRQLGYEGVTSSSNPLEEGYIKCYYYEHINHERITKYEIVTKKGVLS